MTSLLVSTETPGARAAETWTERRRRARVAAEVQRLETYGCDVHEARRLNDGLLLGDVDGKAIRYMYQRSCAKQRGIEWLFTFKTWVECWNKSGKWAQRGPLQHQYVMARFGDVGPYSPDNVEIITATQNINDSHQNKPRSKPLVPPGLGTGRGWSFDKKSRKPYRATCSGVRLGKFATAAEAELAYKAAVMAKRAALLEAK